MKVFWDAIRNMPRPRQWALAALATCFTTVLVAFTWASGPLPVLGAAALTGVLVYFRLRYLADTGGVEHAALCRECGGSCCRIYRQAGRGGSMPDEVPRQRHARDFHGGLPPDERDYGVEPSYDDWRVHVAGDRQYRREVRAAGFDTDYCSYWSPDTGCTVPRGLRPQQCRDFACEELLEALGWD